MREKTQVIGVYDDHDYGANDAGKTFPKKKQSKKCLMDFLDVPLSLRGLNTGEKLTFYWNNRAMFLGFSFAGWLMLHVPVVQLLAFPIGIIGATMAGVLGLALAKSLYETNGFFWAWTIHFIQDVIIIGALFLLSTKTV